jgi:hypothetical protein
MAEYRQNVVLTPTLDLVELLPGADLPFGFDRRPGVSERTSEPGGEGIR